MNDLTPELVLRAYAAGIFPMADGADDDQVHWYDPPLRGILPLDKFHTPKRLQRTVNQQLFRIRINYDFATVIQNCGQAAPNRPSTWINRTIVDVFVRLHQLGYAHSVECWRDDRLVGGLYGIALGGAFFGESMFSRETDASKVALVHLVNRLNQHGFTLLDTQFVNQHLVQFGAIEIPRIDYQHRLVAALQKTSRFI